MTDSNPRTAQLTAHALQIGDRINTVGFAFEIAITFYEIYIRNGH